MIACCQTILIVLHGDVKAVKGYYEGVYSYSGTINGRDYWVKAEGGRAIWYYPQYKDWAIGAEKKIGSNFRGITSISNLESTCPNNFKNQWLYYDTGHNWT